MFTTMYPCADVLLEYLKNLSKIGKDFEAKE